MAPGGRSTGGISALPGHLLGQPQSSVGEGAVLHAENILMYKLISDAPQDRTNKEKAMTLQVECTLKVPPPLLQGQHHCAHQPSLSRGFTKSLFRAIVVTIRKSGRALFLGKDAPAKTVIQFPGSQKPLPSKTPIDSEQSTSPRFRTLA